MLKIENLNVSTRQLVYSDVSYSFETGKLYGIVAVNGSGKTTLFRSMMKLIPLKSGTITIDGRPIEKCRSDVFYYESFEWLDGNLSGMDYLQYVKKTWHSHTGIRGVIDEWDMNEYIRIPVRKYSLGMKQKLIIAMYIVSDAKYMIMDEITNGLDEKNRKLLFSTLGRMRADGKMVFLSSHYRQDIEDICDTMLTIRDRKLAEI